MSTPSSGPAGTPPVAPLRQPAGPGTPTGERAASPAEPHEGIKADASPEVQGTERDQSTGVSRAGSSGTVDQGPGPGDEQPSEARVDGTAGGDALAGVTMTEQDAAEAVPGDEGPANPGERKN